MANDVMPATGTQEQMPWDTDPVLTVEHLTMRFGGLVAISDLSFNVGRGDITALIGPNGAGKTTVFNCVTGFYKPTEGRIVMRHGPGQQTEAVEAVTLSGDQYRRNGKNAVFLLERMPDFTISHKAKVARTFQNIRLFGGMTALENLLVAQHNPLMTASNFTIGGILGLPSYTQARDKSIEKASYWLEQVNLIDRADDPAADLPYGAQRRLEIARAMCTDPHLLCLDEPAAGLNPRESAELNALLKFIRKEHGTSVLLIEHDMGVVMEISDHIVVLDYGEKISDGSAQHVRNDPKVIAAYLGVDEEEAVEDVLADGKRTAKKPAKAATAKKPATRRRKPAAKKAAADAAAATAAAAVMAAPAKTKASGSAKPKTAAKKAASATAKSPARKPAAKSGAGAKAASAKAATRATAKKAAAKPAASKQATKPVTTKPASAKAASTKPEPKAKKPAPAKAAGSKTGQKAPAKAAAKKPAAARSAAAKGTTAKAAKARPAVAARLKAPRGGKADNLTLIKGIGKVNERKLNGHGIFHFDQIAAWKAADVKAAEAYLEFDGRIAREGWVRQAKVLARGGETEFSKRASKGEVASSRAGTGGRARRSSAKGGKTS